jgi:hypothetical protein
MDPNAAALNRIRAALPKYREENAAVGVPAEKASAGEDFDFATEKRMMDSILGPARASKPNVPAAAGRKGAELAQAPASHALVSVMAARLQDVEAGQARLRGELVAKDRMLLAGRRQLEEALAEVAVLRAAVDAAKGEAGAGERASMREKAAAAGREAGEVTIAGLRASNARLLRRVSAMEAFLSDYGLAWVGEEGSEGEDGEGGGSDAPPAPVDFAVLKTRLAQLSSVAGEGKAVVVERNGAHVFEQPRGMPLVLFADGVLLGRGPFRPFGQPAGDAFVSDVLDGFFPSEFKASHPSGLIFDVRDRSEETYSGEGGAPAAAGPPAPTFVAFAGEGRTLAAAGADADRPPARPAARRPAPSQRRDSRVARLAAIGDGSIAIADLMAPLSAAALLSALPPTIVAGGTIVDVRATVAAAMGMGGSPSPSVPSDSGEASAPVHVDVRARAAAAWHARRAGQPA